MCVKFFTHSVLAEKPGTVPGLVDDAKREEQKVFIHDKLEPILAEDKKSCQHVYFMDAAHFVLQPFLGFRWCFERLFVYPAAGRKRFNVQGALNAITQKVVTITNDSYINALSVFDLLRKLVMKHADEVVTVFLYNARYQKYIFIQNQARKLKINLIPGSAYSPNLNLIERLWRHVKHQVLNSCYYDSFPKI